MNSMCAKRIDNSRRDPVTRALPETAPSIKIEFFFHPPPLDRVFLTAPLSSKLLVLNARVMCNTMSPATRLRNKLRYAGGNIYCILCACEIVGDPICFELRFVNFSRLFEEEDYQ